MAVKPNNLSRLESGIRDNHRPFIVYDVETTGVMNGNDNRITQVALASYAYNEREKCYDLQDKIFMLAKPDASVLRNIQDIEHMQAMNPEKTVVDKLKDDFFYNLVKNETTNMVDKDRIEATKEEYREWIWETILIPVLCQDFTQTLPILGQIRIVMVLCNTIYKTVWGLTRVMTFSKCNILCTHLAI